MADLPYIHGYDAQENERLLAQARSVLSLLHDDLRYPAGSRVLEVGCGTGAQTVTLARNSPDARFVSFDRSEVSLERPRERVRAAGVTNVELRREDLFSLPFAPGSFDHAFVCFVLEHLPHPVAALTEVRRFVRPGGTITVFEGDHGSAYFHPDSDVARRAIWCQEELQRLMGGNANIGRQLYPLLQQAGYAQVRVEPKLVYVDASRPHLVDDFIRKTFTWMVQAVRAPAIDARLIQPEAFDAGIAALLRTAEDDGVFCYTFFKGVATVAPTPRQASAQVGRN